MCGIAGIVDRIGSVSNEQVVERMLGVLLHRGPDDVGRYLSEAVGFGFRRLSILDLSSAGHQPMSLGYGAVENAATIVFNGEIYNFVELRRELEGLGHVFRSSGDTEVLLRSYLQWGSECVAKLNGMWAFVIHDRRSGTLFGSRDRFGIKPLFLHQADGRLLFASEIKAIRVSGHYRTRVNRAIASAFLVDGNLDQTNDTFFEGIRHLAPGCNFVYDIASDRLVENRYWDVRRARPSFSDDVVSAYAQLFEDAVALHMRSDVPVGIHLSGGLDSTSIACASARIRAQARAREVLNAFSYIAPEFDESTYIKATVAQTGARLVELSTSPESLWADLERMLWFQDEPVHSLTALVSFQLMRSTAKHGVKVVLNGQGADETLAGYSSYFRNSWRGLAQSDGIGAVWREMKEFGRLHHQSAYGLLQRHLSDALASKLNSRTAYRRVIGWRNRRRAEDGWFSPDVWHDRPPRANSRSGNLSEALAYSQEVDPLPLYLRLEDRNAMAHSIEARLPFLDYRLVEYAYCLPDKWKLRGGLNKYVLRAAMAGRIPEVVRTRVDKMGFPVPARKWFTEQLFEPVMDLLESRQARESGRYRMDAVRRDLIRHRRGEKDFTDTLFAVAQFELWSAQTSA
jgi:asparagine synthase (glutamine-hydrolysing)